MLCTFKKLIYPKTITAAQSGDFTIAVYDLNEKVLDARNNQVHEAKVVGYYLPVVPNIRVDMQGEWQRNAKHGIQFAMSGYTEVVKPTRQGIEAYLSLGLVKGIGPKTAARIYDAFGPDTLRVLDKNPEELLTVKGISKAKLKRICDSYIESRGARDIVTLLTPFGVTPNRAVSIYKHFGAEATDIVRRHPYMLCEMTGIGFLTADNIATSMGLNPTSSERIAAGLLYTLQEAESKGGHLCLPKHRFIQGCAELLSTPEISGAMVAKEAHRLLLENKLELYGDQVFRSVTASAEKRLAMWVWEQLAFSSMPYKGNLEADINAEQKQMRVKLAPEQRQAIKTCLSSHISIITGGPGTGKTLIQRALLGIYAKQYPDATVVCCAPTGRAARRMAQTTGYHASTIHKALGLMAGDDGAYNEPEPLEADLVLVDEISMLDIYLARHLMNAVTRGSQIVLIGDADQLPSVGPGAVLSELIASGMIPVVKLDRVYRQDAGSRIAINAKLIRHNNVGLEYGEDFVLTESANLDNSADLLERFYLEEVARLGIDNVALLTPFRQKTATGVNAMNERLREKVNPPSPLKPEATLGRRMFRQGDKVMWTKNRDDINNGDIGYISGINHHEDSITVYVDFGDGRTAELDLTELSYLDLAYATTVHKSQGSEYSSVIVNLQTAHYVMLKRPL
ncbi:MAG TPA: ATP-dependent RecD-like DNA helicase, partial [Clostridiales bacterium]|nr:ATP-dependent RecD-like DNA helicase [Clostridiales bacterium]